MEFLGLLSLRALSLKPQTWTPDHYNRSEKLGRPLELQVGTMIWLVENI